MTDRGLLELAALAAGIELDYKIRPDGKAFYHSDRNALAADDGGWFAPLTDDGDALRLAVTLRLHIQPSATADGLLPSVEVYDTENQEGEVVEELLGEDPCSATRKAIVRAAAEIGRSMKANPTTDKAT